MSETNNAVHKRLDALEGLLKSLKAPAAARGTTPQEMIRQSAGQGAGVFDAQGNFRPARFDPRGKRIGKATDPETGKELHFGKFLKAAHAFSKHGYSAADSVRLLSDYGVQVSREGDKGTVIKTALAESSGVTGGYTVPTVFSEQLQRLEVENAIVEPRATKMPLTARTLMVPSLDQTSTAGAGNTNLLGGVVASWLEEAGTFPESEPKFRQTELTAWQLCFYTVASINLLQDEAVGLDALLTQLFGWAITWYKDYAFLQGNGVGKPLGVVNAPATIQVTRQSSGKFLWSDVGQMVSKVYHMLSENDLAWVVHPSVIPYLVTMADNAGRPLFIPCDKGVQAPIDRPKGPQSFGKLVGYDVMVSEKVPSLGNTGDVGLYDFSKYLVGEKLDLEIDLSPHVNFLNYQMVWRVVARCDGQPWLNNPITLADNSYQVSPFVVLK